MIPSLLEYPVYFWQLLRGIRSSYEARFAEFRNEDTRKYLEHVQSPEILDLGNGQLRPQFTILKHDQAWQRIMTKRYVEALLKYTEVESLPAGLMVLAGFNQRPIEIEKHFKGRSSYTPRKRLRLAVNSITSFSSKPLILVGLFGIVVTACAFLILTLTVIRKIMFADFQAGWVSLIGSIWCIGGLILSSVGIVGVYLSKIFNQVKNRPLFVVKEILSSTQNSE